MPAEAIIEEHNLEEVSPRSVQRVINSLSKHLRDTISDPNAEPGEPGEFLVFDEDKKRVKVSQISIKKFYSMLAPPDLDNVRRELTARGIYTTWHDVIGATKWPIIFKGLYANHRDRKTADVIFTIIHRGIYTRRRLFRAGLDISDSCPRGCENTETLEHIFFACPASVDVWEFAKRFLRQLNPNFNMSVEAFVIQGTEEGESFDNPSDDVRMAYVASVWKTRNAAMLAEIDADSLSVFRSKLMSMLRLRMSTNVKAGKARTHKFDQIAEYSVQESKLVFTI